VRVPESGTRTAVVLPALLQIGAVGADLAGAVEDVDPEVALAGGRHREGAVGDRAGVAGDRVPVGLQRDTAAAEGELFLRTLRRIRGG
jgi:hypothetical protein